MQGSKIFNDYWSMIIKPSIFNCTIILPINDDMLQKSSHIFFKLAKMKIFLL